MTRTQKRLLSSTGMSVQVLSYLAQRNILIFQSEMGLLKKN